MPSPLCEVKDGAGAYQSTTNGVDVTPSDTITIHLIDTSADSWSIECAYTDDDSDAATVTASLSINTALRTATFTAPSAGHAYIFRSVVNGGVGPDGRAKSTYTTTFGVYTLTASSARVIAANETTEGNSTFGWIAAVNAAIRAGGAGAATASSAITLSTGSNNDVSFAANVATATVHGIGVEISGIAGGASGRTLVLVAFEDVLTIHDEGEGSTAANRIVTGVGDPLIVPVGGVVSLRYDTVSSRWLVTGVSNAIQPADAFQVAVYNGQGQIGSAGRQVPEGDFVGTTGEQTLTNKTISGSSNTITNISGSSVSAATTGAAGTMSAADKTKLDGIQKQGSTTLVTALAIDWSQSSTFSKTISTSSTFTFSNATDGQCVIVAITAGSGNTVTWPTVKWAGGVAPTQTSSGTDVYTFVKIGSTIYGSVVQAMA